MHPIHFNLPWRRLTGSILVLVAAGCSTASTDSNEDDGGRKRPSTFFDAGDLPPVEGPTRLSEAGLYSDIQARVLLPDLFEFAPRYEFWSDGAEKSRWLYLPPATKIDTTSMDHWVFPVGTKVFKEFKYKGKVVETRLLMKGREGTGNDSWWQAAYVWKEDGSDALVALDGAAAVLGTTHDVPKQVDCHNCHGEVSDVLIGVSAIQLSDPIKNPLAALASSGRLTTSPPANIEIPGTGVVKEALGYLHANCGHCHNSEARKFATQTNMRLRLLVGQKTPEETSAFTTTVGTIMRHPLENDTVTTIIEKGMPEKSGLWIRMGHRGDADAMPPTGTQIVDDVGRETIRQWILGWK